MKSQYLETWGITLFVVLVLPLFATACGTLAIGLESTATPMASATEGGGQATQAPTAVATASMSAAGTKAPTQSIPPTATQTVVPSTATQTPKSEPRSSLWVPYRDPKYGYGVALPCFWSVFPSIGSPSVASYDQAFHRAHSVKGQWLNNEWPERAVKLDIVVFDEIDPTLSTVEAARQWLTGEREYVHSTEEVTIGANPAVLAEMRRTDDASVLYLLPVFRLSPTTILAFSVSPRAALDSGDVQRIVESLALSPSQGISIPAVPPEAPVEGREVKIDEEAGYCFAYPSTFEEGEVMPGRYGLVGPVLAEGPGLVRAGLTIDVQDASPGSSLGELVDAYQQQLATASSSVTTRVMDRLYGEPAEMIEYFSGREGARSLLAVYGNRLYHARFTPSMTVFPQAVSDVNYLFEVVSNSFTFLTNDLLTDEPIQFYVILPGDGGQSGPAVGCDDSAIAVESGRARTGSLVTDVYVALDELLSNKTASLDEKGYVHSLQDVDVRLNTVIVSGGAATIDVSLMGAFQLIGTCTDARMEAQILLTVFQYPSVDSAMILLNGENMKRQFDTSGTVGYGEPYRRSEIAAFQ